MGLFTPKYPDGAEPARQPSRREQRAEKQAADNAQARSEGWIVPERGRRQSVLSMLLDGVEQR